MTKLYYYTGVDIHNIANIYNTITYYNNGMQVWNSLLLFYTCRYWLNFYTCSSKTKHKANLQACNSKHANWYKTKPQSKSSLHTRWLISLPSQMCKEHDGAWIWLDLSALIIHLHTKDVIYSQVHKFALDWPCPDFNIGIV